MDVRWPSRLAVLGAAGVIAGAILLPLSIVQDLTAHDHAGDALLEQLSPRDAQIVREHLAREAANPWHRVIVTGEAFLIGGLGALYLAELACVRRLTRAVASAGREAAPGFAGTATTTTPPV